MILLARAPASSAIHRTTPRPVHRFTSTHAQAGDNSVERALDCGKPVGIDVGALWVTEDNFAPSTTGLASSPKSPPAIHTFFWPARWANVGFPQFPQPLLLRRISYLERSEVLLGAGDCGENSSDSTWLRSDRRRRETGVPSTSLAPGAPFRRTHGVRSAPRYGDGRQHIDGAATIDVGVEGTQAFLPYPQQGHRIDGGKE